MFWNFLKPKKKIKYYVTCLEDGRYSIFTEGYVLRPESILYCTTDYELAYQFVTLLNNLSTRIYELERIIKLKNKRSVSGK